jgi:pre-mRNA-processing factor 6
MRKTRSADALKKCQDDVKEKSIVVCTIARLFWAERKIEKARQWFERAVSRDQEFGRTVAAGDDLGDSWAWWLKFEREYGTEVNLTIYRS